MTIKTIKKYLPHLEVKGQAIALLKFPLFFRSSYNFEKLTINGKIFLAISVQNQNLGPRQFKKHSEILFDAINLPQIWFLEKLHFHKIQRMIENNFDFVIADKQVHLPSIGIALRHEKTPITPKINSLKPLAINILIREILKGDLSGKSKTDLSLVFLVQLMQISRAIESLLQFDLCIEKKIGTFKYVYFKGRADLWEFVKNKVESPVEETLYLKENLKGLPYSGLTALSKTSMLAEDELPTYAIEKAKFKAKQKKSHLVLEDDAKVKIELWNRAPILIERGNINALDIYFILKKEPDERIQIELDTMLKNEKLKQEAQ